MKAWASRSTRASATSWTASNAALAAAVEVEAARRPSGAVGSAATGRARSGSPQGPRGVLAQRRPSAGSDGRSWATGRVAAVALALILRADAIASTAAARGPPGETGPRGLAAEPTVSNGGLSMLMGSAPSWAVEAPPQARPRDRGAGCRNHPTGSQVQARQPERRVPRAWITQCHQRAALLLHHLHGHPVSATRRHQAAWREAPPSD